MAWTGDTVAALNKFMNYRDMRDIVPEVKFRNPVLNRFRKALDKDVQYVGNYGLVRLETEVPYNAHARPEAKDVLLPGAEGYDQMQITLKQFMASTGMTQEEFEECKGQPLAAANLAEEKIKHATNGMNMYLNREFATDGTGRLGRVGANIATNTVTLDNTYLNFGWLGTHFIRKGMLVDIWTFDSLDGGPLVANSTAITLVGRSYRVTSVAANGNDFDIAAGPGGTAVPGTLTAGDWVFSAGSIASVDDDDVVFEGFNNTVGMMHLIDDGAVYDADPNYCWQKETDNFCIGSWAGVTLQNLTRTTYPQLVSTVTDGASPGTPEDWTIRDLQDQIRAIDEEGDGGGFVSALYMNGAMRDCLNGKAAIADPMLVQNVDAGKWVPGMYIESFRTSNGRLIPIIPMVSLPPNTMYGVCEKDYNIYEPITVGWYKGDGQGIWRPAPGARNLTFEAWLRTRINLGARRCDNSFVWRDLKEDSLA